jgi:uncharacterized protein (TIGR02001 family)
MKTINRIAFSAALFAAAAVPAYGDYHGISGNVTLTTDYRFRGIAQGDRSPAIQGGFDVAAERGFYAGTWASNVNFTEAAIELNYYAGYTTAVKDHVEIDAGVIYYNYLHGPARELDYVELYTRATVAAYTLGIHYSPDYFGGTGAFVYVHGGYQRPLAEGLSAGIHAGYNRFQDDAFLGSKDAYFDWRVSLSLLRFGLAWEFAYIDSSIGQNDCFGGEKLCRGGVALSVSKRL